ncbi:hypothetical protein JCM11491_006637 [Sporobolomyces phaffii]
MYGNWPSSWRGAVASALESNQLALLARVDSARSESITKSVADMIANGDASAVLEGLKRAKGEQLTAEQIALVSQIFQQ